MPEIFACACLVNLHNGLADLMVAIDADNQVWFAQINISERNDPKSNYFSDAPVPASTSDAPRPLNVFEIVWEKYGCALCMENVLVANDIKNRISELLAAIPSSLQNEFQTTTPKIDGKVEIAKLILDKWIRESRARIRLQDIHKQLAQKGYTAHE